MMGFTKAELVNLMDEQNISKEKQEEILPMMKEHYDGYCFAIKAEEKEQIEKYSNFEDIKAIKKLNKYTVIAVVDDVYVTKID